MNNKFIKSVALAIMLSVVPTTVYADNVSATYIDKSQAVAIGVGITINLPQAIKDMLNKLTGVIDKYITDYKELPTKTDVPKDKVWSISFDKDIDSTTMTKNTIKVLDVNGKEINVTIKPTSNSKVCEVRPPSGGYTAGATYALIIRKGIEGKLSSGKLKQEIAMKFVIANGTGTGTTQKDSIDTIIKVLSGNRYLEPKERTYAEWNTLHYAIAKDNYNIYDISNYYNHVESIKNFNSKYANNPLYADITDLDNYKSLPNLTINFNNVNNSNNYGRGSSVYLKYYSKTTSNMPTSSGVRIAPLKSNDGIYYNHMELLEDKTGFGTFIWRPDFEKAMLDEINARRKAKGLNSLTLNNDLIAMAKHSAKLSQLGFTHNKGYTASVLYGSNSQKIWARGTVPFAFDNTQYEDKNNPSNAVAVKLETNANKMFGYTKPIKTISESTAIFTTPKQMLNAWEFNDSSIMDTYYIHSSELRVSYSPKGTTKEKFDSPVNLNENIYNPNMKTIGIGSTYEPPLSKENKHGTLGLYIITSN